MSERLKIALPNGELRSDVVQFMGDVGLDIEPTDRGLMIPVGNMPIDFVLVRASDVPKVVEDEESLVKAGITGSDILWENSGNRDNGHEVPVYELAPEASSSSLYLGASADFVEFVEETEGREFSVKDLSGKMLATKYMNIAKDYMDQNNLVDVNAFYTAGSDEGLQYVYPECVAVIGVKNTGSTLRANRISVVDEFHDVTLRMVQEASKFSSSDERILDDFREKITSATLVSQPVTSAYL